MRESQAHRGPKERVARRVPADPPEALESLGHRSLASEDPLDHQA